MSHSRNDETTIPLDYDQSIWLRDWSTLDRNSSELLTDAGDGYRSLTLNDDTALALVRWLVETHHLGPEAIWLDGEKT